MKNITIGILTIISVGSLLFGYTQKNALDSAVATCVSEKQELEKMAQLEQERAQVAEHEAMIQKTICVEQLKALKK